MSILETLREITENTIGEVQEGKVVTDRGHFALSKQDGLEIKLKPRRNNQNYLDSTSSEALLLEESIDDDYESDDSDEDSFEPVKTPKKKAKKPQKKNY